MRGYCKHFSSRDFDALLAYEAALKLYAQVRDGEGIFACHTRKAGIYNTIGQKALAWAEVSGVMPLQTLIVETRSKHAFLGETATAAFALGHATIALRYQDLAVQLTERDKDPVQLSSALSRRADMELQVRQFKQARRDLEQVKQLAVGKQDLRVREALDAHSLEVDAHSWLPDDPARAIEAFTRALDAAKRSQPQTEVSRLLVERAEIYAQIGDTRSAEKDLRDAFDGLRREENGNLEQRKAGVAEQVWSSYFSRFQSAYRLLIKQLINAKHPEEAFEYAEKSRAYDLLNLVHEGELDSMKLPELQAVIPADTTIIEYCVLEDRTYVWIVTRGNFRPLELPIRRAEIERWSSTLQTAAHRHDLRAFEVSIRAAYDKLIAPFLLSIQKPTRLVFIPDGAIFGLPIAALQDPNTRRYVLQEGSVSIAASAKMYLYSLRRDQTMPRDDEPTELLVGDPAFDPAFITTMKLRRLPFAGREVLRIRQIYGANAKVLTDINATVSEFLALAPLKTIVHVAAHGIPSATDPSRSMLLLASSGGNSGALDAEQMWQKLTFDHTRLLVLSACSSAGGLPVGPDGIAPLVRPLISKGIPAVVGSLWEVDDATAEPLLVSFHRQYRQGNDAAEALRSAQLEMLNKNNPGLRSVLAWAPFQVIGHASSPFASPRQ
jgi:CHAT domain-containing protein